MSKPPALILRTAGTNCDEETRHALELAGAEVKLIHINLLTESPRPLGDSRLLVLPGGFTYGDDVAAGKILALELMHTLRPVLEDFIFGGGAILGICNGFQTLVKTGLLPDAKFKTAAERILTLTHNVSGRFESRWVRLQSPDNVKCIFAEPGEELELPVAHAEGRLAARDPKALKELAGNGQVVYRYVGREGKTPAYPDDPNGSADCIAGICDRSGRIFGFMPHPERHIYGYQHPRWNREGRGNREGDGLRLFRRAVDYFKNN
ncbi:MAG: phosphoribosylformylglycinamidine synthase I [Planctomycetota bacterium]|jgi:phosphoribosylformylglycinamidine synthase|nr:phosphoribosylformylglycinamidine synthase I [Planctomycetota bacterium]